MRMWMIPPKFMCQKHILGEHGEIHKHRHIFERNWSIRGRIENGVHIEPMSMKIRHDQLAKYMNHKSPYIQPNIEYLSLYEQEVTVDLMESYVELVVRCPNCGEKIIQGILDKEIDVQDFIKTAMRLYPALLVDKLKKEVGKWN